MYAVVTTGGKQYRVEEGARLEIELIRGETVALRPVLLVDGGTVLATPSELAGVAVNARVVGEAKAPKIRAFTYQAKGRRRRRWGHRQQHSIIEITSITRG
jgi:large subunit ribosomal protein L21